MAPGPQAPCPLPSCLWCHICSLPSAVQGLRAPKGKCFQAAPLRRANAPLSSSAVSWRHHRPQAGVPGGRCWPCSLQVTLSLQLLPKWPSVAPSLLGSGDEQQLRNLLEGQVRGGHSSPSAIPESQNGLGWKGSLELIQSTPLP